MTNRLKLNFSTIVIDIDIAAIYCNLLHMVCSFLFQILCIVTNPSHAALPIMQFSREKSKKKVTHSFVIFVIRFTNRKWSIFCMSIKITCPRSRLKAQWLSNWLRMITEVTKWIYAETNGISKFPWRSNNCSMNRHSKISNWYKSFSPWQIMAILIHFIQFK